MKAKSPAQGQSAVSPGHLSGMLDSDAEQQCVAGGHNPWAGVSGGTPHTQAVSPFPCLPSVAILWSTVLEHSLWSPGFPWSAFPVR